MIEIKLQALKSFKNWVNPLRKHRISEGKGRCGIALNFPCFKDGRADSFLVSSLSALLGRTSARGGRLKAVFIVWNCAEHIRNSTDMGCGVCVRERDKKNETEEIVYFQQKMVQA